MSLFPEHSSLAHYSSSPDSFFQLLPAVIAATNCLAPLRTAHRQGDDARYDVTDGHAQDFVTNDEFLLLILKALTQCTSSLHATQNA
jgi:hypothetical protein